MNLTLVKLERYSGDKASIYTLYDNVEEKTLFETFIEENKSLFLSELKDISNRLIAIGNKTGAREGFFKINEGNPGDGVCALYDNPDSNLRLYCIRYGTALVVLGGGGNKPKNIRALQENPKLMKENYILREVSKTITERLKNKDIWFVNNYKDIEGELDFNTDENE